MLKEFFIKNDYRIFNSSVTWVFSNYFSFAINSEYIDNVPSGEYKDGILSQDLTNSSFGDNYFDIVITEDVLEHIPDYKKVFSEIYRILKPEGVHFFSMPYHYDKYTTEKFDCISGEIILHEPIEYHGDPFRGKIPCFIDYGVDIFNILSEIGFKETKLQVSKYKEYRKYSTFDCSTFTSIK